MNPLWSAERENSSWNTNEIEAAYLCSPVNSTNYETTTYPWKSYYKADDTNVNYVIGGPSVEMYVKSYNQTHDKNSSGNDALGCQYQENKAPGYGYKVYGEIQNSGWYTNDNVLDYGTNYNSMYCGKDGNKTGFWWLASPSAYDAIRMCYADGRNADLNYSGAGGNCPLSPLISLKSSFILEIEN